MQSDKEQRDNHAKKSAEKIANSLATAWREGNRLLVKRCIMGACAHDNIKNWKIDTAALLNKQEAAEFIAYIEKE
jgi:hypothetical protein